MKICLVSAFPPSRRLLNEYGLHIARALVGEPRLSLTVLGDELEEPAAELEDFEVVRCWQLNRTFNQPRLLRTLRAIRPDVVWFNLLFSTFGNAHNPAAAFSGMALPALARAAGFYTHVTLHHLMDHVDLSDAGIRHPRLFRAVGAIATRMVLLANSVSVLLPAYRRTLVEKYGGGNVHFRSHGIFSARPEPPDPALRNRAEQRVLVFGKWGTYKRLELLLNAFQQVRACMPAARLVIAGGNHPMAPGYVESMAERYRDQLDVEFTGYVAEERMGSLFRAANVLVMPYSSATGASGVAHQGCEFGLPMISADIDDFRDMAEHENLAMDFYPTGDAGGLARRLLNLLADRERQQRMAEQNFAAALRMTMPSIVREYLRGFEREQHVRAQQPIKRFRRIPAWIPSRSAIFRAAAPRWSPWM